MTRRILITGAAGNLGKVLRARLAAQLKQPSDRSSAWQLRWSDLAPLAPLTTDEVHAGDEVIQCDLADADAVNQLLQDVYAVVHLGGYATESSWEVLASANILGMIHLYEAARRQHVDRILFASSNHAIGLYPRTAKLDHHSSPRPDSRYGVTKAFGEDLAWLYAHKHNVRSFCMRIGSCVQTPRNARMLSTWLSYDDFLQLVETGLTADYRFEIVYGVSANSQSWWNNQRAYELGYQPKDNAADFAQTIHQIKTDNAISENFQGGNFAAEEFEMRLEDFKP